jgi:hypothetical protein
MKGRRYWKRNDNRTNKLKEWEKGMQKKQVR